MGFDDVGDVIDNLGLDPMVIATNIAVKLGVKAVGWGIKRILTKDTRPSLQFKNLTSKRIDRIKIEDDSSGELVNENVSIVPNGSGTIKIQQWPSLKSIVTVCFENAKMITIKTEIITQGNGAVYSIKQKRNFLFMKKYLIETIVA